MATTPERISRYPIIRPLGAGGMGQVYLATDPDLDRRIALKVLRGDEAGDAGARQRLRAEARALAALNHPGIVTVYEVGRDGDLDFIAMEFLDGLSLRAAIDRPGEPLDIEMVLGAAAQVARALDAAHSAGVLHRDVKPDNVMIDKSGAVKVVDFGIAHRTRAPTAPPAGQPRAGAAPSPFAHTLPLDLSKTTMATNTIFGTPGYMAPEVLLGEKATAASDVYALGVMLYEALSGSLPYAAATGEELIDALGRVVDETATHRPLADERPDLPAEVCATVERMLEKAAERRPSMPEVSAALEATGLTHSRPFHVTTDAVALNASGAAPTVPAEVSGDFDTVPQERPPTRRRVGVGTVAAMIAIVGAVVAVGILTLRPTGGAAPPVAADAGARAAKTVLVDNLAGDFSDLGNSGPSAAMLANVLGETLASAGVDVVRLKGADRTGDLANRAADLGADIVLSVRVERSDDGVVAATTLRSSAGDTLLEREVRAATLAEAMFESALETARIAAPDKAPRFAQQVADVAFQLGLVAYSDRNWNKSTPLFEQAVTAKPKFPVAWYYLAWSRAWIAAPRERSLEAARRAQSTADTELERKLGAALELYLVHEFRDAAALLEPLLAGAPRDRDLLYLYAEVLFHDGQINRAIEVFERCLLVAPTFGPAKTHLIEVATARRSFSDLRRLHGSSQDAGTLAYLEGDLARARELKFNNTLLDVVERRYDELDASYVKSKNPKALAYRLARLLERGRRGEARQLFRQHWPRLDEAGKEPRGAFGLQDIGRVLLIGELGAEVDVIRRWWRDHADETPSNLVFGTEIELFAPAVVGEEPLDATRPSLTTRERATAEALALEAGGRLEAAAKALRALVDEPAGSYRDLTLQHATIRVLRKLEATDELAERCARWSRPPRYDPAIIVLRRACDVATK